MLPFQNLIKCRVCRSCLNKLLFNSTQSCQEQTEPCKSAWTSSTFITPSIDHIQATPPVLTMWPRKLKLNEEKSKLAGLAQHFLQRLLRLAKGASQAYHLPEKSVLNVIWLLVSVSYWPLRDSSLLVVPHLFAVPVFILWVELEKFE